MGAFLALAFFLTIPATSPSQIVQQSVTNTNRDWNAVPRFNFAERDIVTKRGVRTVKTYRVLMIDGSPYNQAIAIDGKPLSRSQAAAEERQLQQEIAWRRTESPARRQKRVAEYERERHRDLALMAEMAKAFDYQLIGEETVNGRLCYALVATPKPSYQPLSRETKVLKGMRGRLWIDTRDFPMGQGGGRGFPSGSVRPPRCARIPRPAIHARADTGRGQSLVALALFDERQCKSVLQIAQIHR
jgi:hypothetical protein